MARGLEDSLYIYTLTNVKREMERKVEFDEKRKVENKGLNSV